MIAANAKISVAINEAPIQKPSTRASIDIPRGSGNASRATRATAAEPAHDSAAPIPAEMTPSTAHSVASCRARRVRLAPSATRMATSRCRVDARVRRSAATFAHAISRTRIAPACISRRPPRSGAVTNSLIDTIRATYPRLASGKSVASRALSMSSWLCAPRVVALGVSRTIVLRKLHERCALS